MRTSVLLFLFAFAAAASAQDPDGVYDIVEEAPQPVGGMQALTARVVYPDSAMAARVEGVVFVSAVVDTAGIARGAVVRRAPEASLGAAAAAALEGLAFTPGRIGGLPVPTRVTLPVRFALPPMPDEIEADPNSPARPIGGWERVRANVEWPEAALRANVEGVIRVAFTVRADGTPADVRVVEADVRQDEGRMSDVGQPKFRTGVIRSGAGEGGRRRPTVGQARRALERAIIEAVYESRFVPAVNNGEVMESELTYGLEFILYGN